MLNINDPVTPVAKEPEAEQMAKAHPAQALINRPGWTCTKCSHKNPVTAAFCERCEVPD